MSFKKHDKLYAKRLSGRSGYLGHCFPTNPAKCLFGFAWTKHCKSGRLTTRRSISARDMWEAQRNTLSCTVRCEIHQSISWSNAMPRLQINRTTFIPPDSFLVVSSLVFYTNPANHKRASATFHIDIGLKHQCHGLAT
jgi:hypothetical protein